MLTANASLVILDLFLRMATVLMNVARTLLCQMVNVLVLLTTAVVPHLVLPAQRISAGACLVISQVELQLLTL